MKKKVLALILGMAMLFTALVYAETDAPDAEPDVTTSEQTDEITEPEQDAVETPDNQEEPESNDNNNVETPDDPEITDEPEKKDDPEITVEPETSVEPEETTAPETPVEPEEPTEPETPDEPEEPTEPEAPVEPEAPAEEPVFTASVKVELKNEGQLYYGDSVTLQAVVENANAAYTVRWEYYDEEASLEKNEDVWVACHTGEDYTFTVNEVNAALTYRVVVNDTIICVYKLPAVLERPVEETEAPAEDADAETDQSTETEEPVEDEPVEEEPVEEEPVVDEPAEEEAPAPELDPNRGIDIHAEWEGDELHFGDVSTLVAELKGYDNAVYTLQWQTSKDNASWVDVEGATASRYDMIVTEENYLDYWRVVVTVTEVTE